MQKRTAALSLLSTSVSNAGGETLIWIINWESSCKHNKAEDYDYAPAHTYMQLEKKTPKIWWHNTLSIKKFALSWHMAIASESTDHVFPS